MRTRFIKNLSVGLDSGKVQSVNSAAPVRRQMIHRPALLSLVCPPSPEKTGRGEELRHTQCPGPSLEELSKCFSSRGVPTAHPPFSEISCHSCHTPRCSADGGEVCELRQSKVVLLLEILPLPRGHLQVLPRRLECSVLFGKGPRESLL